MHPCRASRRPRLSRPCAQVTVLRAAHDPARLAALLSQGMSVDAVGPSGTSAMHLAALWGMLEQLSALLGAGANVHLANRKGDTPAHVAVRLGASNSAVVLGALKVRSAAACRTARRHASLGKGPV